METKIDDKPLSYQEAVEIKQKICNYCRTCNYCPLDSENNGLDKGCGTIFFDNPNKTEEILKKWMDEHPVKTNRDKFIEVFGEIMKYDDKCNGKCDFEPHHYCTWWNQEYIEPYKGKEKAVPLDIRLC